MMTFTRTDHLTYPNFVIRNFDSLDIFNTIVALKNKSIINT